jgi:tRNA-specific 2-thiouridylase
VVAIDKDGTAIENTPELISEGNGDRFHYAVRRGEDLKKDQSYMLWRLPQYVLSKLLLPLSDEEKSSVRTEAQRAGLSVAEREESQEICFVPDGDYASFIESRTAPSPHGCFVDEDGNVLGEHKGIIRYTLGQRRGLGISSSSRIFVTDIDIEKNTITLSANDKYTDSLTVTDFVFSGITGPDSGSELCLSVKLRYAAPPVPCRVTFDGDRATVTLSSPVRAVTPGQSAVFYDKDILAFGGFIR